MQVTINHPRFGMIDYTESVWTGKKKIMINGVELVQADRTHYAFPDGKLISVTGNFLSGAAVEIDGERIGLTEKIKWYEILLGCLPFFIVLVWGNSPALVKVIPMVGRVINRAIGGAIGVGLGSVLSVLSLFFLKSVKPIGLKILIGIGMMAVAFGVGALLGIAITAS